MFQSQLIPVNLTDNEKKRKNENTHKELSKKLRAHIKVWNDYYKKFAHNQHKHIQRKYDMLIDYTTVKKHTLVSKRTITR